MAREPFPGERPKDWTPPGGKARTGPKWWQWVLIVFGGLVVLLALVPTPDKKPGGAASVSPQAAPPGAPAPLAVTAKELAAAFEANEVAAQQRYGGKLLAVTGTVAGITLDFMDEPVVQLEGANQFLPVQADFDKPDAAAVAALEKGRKLTVVCEELSEAIGSPMLDGCRLGD